MILYKYTSYDAGIAILKSMSIGYSRPRDLNDPFEVTAHYESIDESDPFSELSGWLAKEAKKSIWKTETAVLSLSRAPLNALMWAHYGVSHTGFVIGFDADEAGFTDESRNLIPAHFGSVIYSHTKPTHSLVGPPAKLNVGNEYSWRPDIREKLERLFLYKAGVWSYEEEVRVVKCIKDIELGREIPSGPLTPIELKNLDRPLYAASFAVDAVKELYLGVRNPLLNDADTTAENFAKSGLSSTAKLYGCRVEDDTWQLERFDLCSQDSDE